VKRCSICNTQISDFDLFFTCTECDSPYHEICWKEMGGCATYGCKAAAVAEKPPLPASVSRGWGDEKICPACSNRIPSSGLGCACGARFPWSDPMTKEDYESWLREDRQQKSRRTQLVVLFIVTILGLPAPLTGTIAGIQAYRSRTLLVGEVGTYLALGYGAAVIGMVYALVFLLLAIGL
jgi:RING finger family protein